MTRDEFYSYPEPLAIIVGVDIMCYNCICESKEEPHVFIGDTAFDDAIEYADIQNSIYPDKLFTTIANDAAVQMHIDAWPETETLDDYFRGIDNA